MPGFNVVDEVSQSLVSVLQNALAGTATVLADDLQGPPQNALRLTAFLFEAGEDPSARNRPRIRSLGAPPALNVAKPPMALLLRYLLTPWGGNESARHRILGRAMQVLYDNAVISGPQLVGSLATEGHALKITLAPLSIEERTRVWHAVQRPYRLSVSYEVRVVNLDTETVESARPVAERRFASAVKDAAPEVLP